MIPERAKLLAELVTEMHEKDGDFIPQEAWAAVQKAFALPYLEFLVFRRAPDGVLEFLLTHRTDEFWHGWHIPGGIWRTTHSVGDGCKALAKQELGIDTPLAIVAKAGWEKWHDHPYGNPISHICICTSPVEIQETDSIKWFRQVPSDMIDDNGHHVEYIKSALKQIETQKLL